MARDSSRPARRCRALPSPAPRFLANTRHRSLHPVITLPKMPSLTRAVHGALPFLAALLPVLCSAAMEPRNTTVITARRTQWAPWTEPHPNCSADAKDALGHFVRPFLPMACVHPRRTHTSGGQHWVRDATCVVVAGLWLSPSAASVNDTSALRRTDYAQQAVGFHGKNNAKDTLWLETAVQGELWAARHNSTFQLFIFSGPSAAKACYNVVQQRWLGANWCRIPALIDTMKRFPEHKLLMYLDTDAFINDMSTSASALLHRAHVSDECAAESPRACQPHAPALRDGDTLIWLWMNTLWGECRGTTGTMMMRRGERTTALLRVWWENARNGNVGIGDQSDFLSCVGWREGVKTLAEDSFTYNSSSTFVIHVCGGCLKKRVEDGFEDGHTSLRKLLSMSRRRNGVGAAAMNAVAQRLWDRRIIATFRE